MRIGLLLLTFLAIFFSCKNTDSSTSESSDTKEVNTEIKNEAPAAEVAKTFGNVTVEDAKKMMSQNADLVIIDVRTPEEIEKGKIEGAIEMDFYSPDFSKKIASLNKEKEYLVYCQSGVRSAKCMDMMQENGFVSVKNMLGGFNEWAE